MKLEFIKVCGLKTKQEVEWAHTLGYTAYGVMMHAPSPRCVSQDQAISLAQVRKSLHSMPSQSSHLKMVSVVVGIKWREVAAVADYFDFVQLYEVDDRELQLILEKSQNRKWKLIVAGTEEPKLPSHQYSHFLYDQSRGAGEVEAFPAWLKLKMEQKKVILAGGLNPQNVAQICQDFAPWGVDVSSGVEKERGMKNFELMKNFIEAIRGKQ